jgi:hypothetical protein
MKKVCRLLLLSAATALYCHAGAQLPADPRQLEFPEIEFMQIPGAPTLSRPILIGNKEGTLKSRGAGYAAPAFWDWNKDGKKDLLIGEFFSGGEDGMGKVTGSHIRVFFNKGTAKQPRFDDFVYASSMSDFGMDLERKSLKVDKLTHLSDYGTPISIPQFCCMPTIPQFTDLNGDGYPDLYSGTYSYGDVYWFRGSRNGYWQGESLPQEGLTHLRKSGPTFDTENMDSFGYWVYSAVAFNPLKKHGLIDMIVGGLALRTSANTGTRQVPSFGKRLLLLDTRGNPIWKRKEGVAIPHIADWDRDGIPDLLFTSSNNVDSVKAVYFCKGVWQQEELKFEPAVPLFDIPSRKKSFPGHHPVIYVEDVNDDGIPDLLLGTLLMYENGLPLDEKNWNNHNSKGPSKPATEVKKNTLHTEGRVFVFYGK